MRIGTTSFIFPADIITNVKKLAGSVEDIELLIFELDDDLNAMPDRTMMQQLRRIAADHDMTYTVHLPMDLDLAGPNRKASVEKAAKAIRGSRELNPWGYVIHLEYDSRTHGKDLGRWVENAAASLTELAAQTGDMDKLCVENLESHALQMIDTVLEWVPVSCCLDVGHLWKQGFQALDVAERWLPRLRVVHLHGVGQRDHKSLALAPHHTLDPVMELLSREFDGVLTLEVFDKQDLDESMLALEQSLARVGSGAIKKPGYLPAL